MGKYNVLVVDDEIHAINGIKFGVNWEKLDIENVYTANNLSQAQEVFKHHHIDLLLSDIDMPKGSGIDLLRWVREHYDQVEALFLTCHSDFTYAKEAIRLKSLNYLLKPIDYVELEEELQSALLKIKQEQERDEVETSFIQLKKFHQSHLRERFWIDLMTENISSEQKDMVAHYKKYQLQYDQSARFLPILIHVFNVDNEVNFKEDQDNELTYSLKSAVYEKIVAYDLNTTVIHLPSKYILAIIEKNDSLSDKNIVHNCDQFIQKANNQFGYELCCYIGKSVQAHEVLDVVKKLHDKDRNNVMSVNKTFQWKENEKHVFIPVIPKDEWLHLMSIGAKEDLIVEVEEMISSWKNINLDVTWESLHSFFQDFLQIIFYTLQKKGLKASETFSKELFEKPGKTLQTVDSLQEWTVFIIDIVMDQLHQAEGSTNSVVNKVKQYINENIGTHRLSREDIANYAYFNPDYLARVFKREVGISISEYIIQQRIKYAKELLLHTNMSISDISMECGYSNFSYFSTLFKKMTDFSPMDFRKNSKEK